MVLSAPGALEVDSFQLYIECDMVTPSLFFHVMHMGTKPERYTKECGERESAVKPGNNMVAKHATLNPTMLSPKLP